MLALRHQVLILQRRMGKKRVDLRAGNRILWVGLSRVWSGLSIPALERALNLLEALLRHADTNPGVLESEN